MKKLSLVLLHIVLCTLCIQSFAQNENNNWYFGNNAGIDFNSGSPVAITNGALSTTEGCSAISDMNGNLLFYTEGINVYNRNHVSMPNGFGLFGGFSASESAIIIPMPGSSTLYYIFTVPDMGSGGLCYSIVDMTLNGGLGDITIKNFPVFSVTTEQLSAAHHSNGTDYWILIHENTTDAFSAFQLSAAGLNLTPIISNVGLVYNMSIGYIKFSHDARRVAITNTYMDAVELFDFDNATGVVSNSVTWPAPSIYPQPYGIEFSPDNNKLYFATSGNGGGFDSLFQFDLLAGSSAAILASGLVVGSTPNQYLGPLQLGPDCKIYVARYNTGYVGCINDPDVSGVACNYVDTAVFLAGRMSQFGLPNLIQNCLVGPPVVNFIASDRFICPGSCIDFTNLSSGATSYEWIFTGASPATSTDINPTFICYNTPGLYSVTLIATNAVGTDTVTLNNLIHVYPQPTVPVITQVGDTLFSSTGFGTYQWYYVSDTIPGATNYFYVATQSGNYNLVVTDDNGCTVGVGILNVIAGVNEFGVSSRSFGMGFEVYPNPVRNEFYVTRYILNGGDATLQVYDAIGREIYSQRLQTANCKLQIANWSEGIYLLKITSGENIMTKKIIIEK